METSLRFSRRTFVAWVGGASAGFYLFGRLPGAGAPTALAQVPGGSLDPTTVAKFQTPLLIPPVMPRAGTIKQPGGKSVDYYEISMKQITQQILPAGLPATTVWGYGAKAAQSKRGLLIHNAPSLTIEASWNRPVRVKWINELVDASGNFRPHLLPVDPTLHWANPPGGTADRDSRPTFTETPGAYTGPVPIVTHVHGAVGVADDSDGYAEAWYLPAANNIPAGYATEGTWYDFFAGKAAAAYGVEWGPGFATFQYPNHNRASTIWYHDHALGMTRLNVYAGPAGFYLIRGGPDDVVLDSRTGLPASLPGPAPRENDKFPPNKPYREIAIAIQDRSFNGDGSLFYPDTRALFDGIVRRLHPGRGVLADLESRVLREHDHGQRQHLAVPGRRAAPLPVPLPQRLPVALPDPRLRPDPRGRGMADRQRGRLPRRPGERHRQPRQPTADGTGRARRCDRRLHQRAAWEPRPRQRRPRRAVRRR